ncbi:ATP-dependent DNA helicase RecQ [Desulfonatronum thiosulfatophilum]|uniref:DNA 3'-5' helicase n=1 Tax=Desulfonatronum thiosulfatophilum TaxID=617002 RepID=A0A1G6ET58_9BACT|nr:RecQ family ATP-dependent DNA helicase [Desulfonatronum thiosulfatophilum]SDB60630.1 ATP-dependent DNA helicase RecQ [Desulfonatronum thiosulfatophilum]
MTLDEYLRNGVVIDLEIHPEENRLLKIGVVDLRDRKTRHYQGRIHAGDSLAAIDSLFSNGSFLLGHNILGHDLPWLREHFPATGVLELPPLDTLHLSPLAFPRNPYHHLVKDYKLVKVAVNDPVQDCLQAERVFHDEIEAFRRLPPEQLLFYGSVLARSYPASGFGEFLSILAGRPLPDRQGNENYWNGRVAELACATAGGSVFRDLWEMPEQSCCLGYILAWLEVAGGNSVLPAWVWKNHAAIPAMLRSLRETPCTDPGCKYCRNAFDSKIQLQRYFGYDDYLPVKGEDPPLQKLVVETLIRGHDCLAVLPTGAGKSLCYQLPGLMKAEQRKTLTIIISPLQSLMKDQVDGLTRKGILNGCTINSTLTLIERAKTLESIRLGDRDLVWIAPEQLRNAGVKETLRSREVGMVIMDEAHCFSKWGHDFRPDYLALASFLKDIAPEPQSTGTPRPEPQIACFTATAKPDVRDEILRYFVEEMGRELVLFEGGHERPNLRFDVIPCTEAEKLPRIDAILNDVLPQEGPGGAIVFVATRRKAEELASGLKEMGWEVDYYHAGRTPEDRAAVQEQFLAGQLRVITATNAFGMGVDKSDVRAVIHASTPGSLENYLQEAGRAGRDRQPAMCCLLYDPEDLNTQFELCCASEVTDKDFKSLYGGLKSLAAFRQNPTLVMTSGELLASEEFAAYEFDILDANDSMRDTKVRIALSWLERGGKVRRGDNKTLTIQGRLLTQTREQALSVMAPLKLSRSERELWLGLLDILMQAGPKDSLNTDYLSERLGTQPIRILNALSAMRQVRILNHDLNMTAFVRKGIADDSETRLDRYSSLEEHLLKLMEEDEPDAKAGGTYNLPLRHVCQRLKDQGLGDATPAQLLRVMELLMDEKLLRINQLSNATYQVHLRREWREVRDAVSQRNQVTRVLLRFLLDKIPAGVKGKNLLVSFCTGEMEETLKTNLVTGLMTDLPKRCKEGLFALHHARAICLQNGLSIIRPAMTITVLDAKGRFTKADYEGLSVFYKQKIAQVHIMGRFAELGAVFDGIGAALRFVRDYFQKSSQAFLETHLKDRKGILELPVSKEQHAAILNTLNPVQTKIVQAPADRNMLVVAGPGSGKTRIIVHRIAYLLKVLRVRPGKILAVAFNRNAVVELRRRLKELLGRSAAAIRVHTYHSLAMAITGRSLVGSRGDETVFTSILREAVEHLARNRDMDSESALDWRERIMGLEHILVDEYQDIDELEYEFLSLLAGRGEADQSRRPSLLAVGDADQNIYAFKGSNVRFIHRFAAEYETEPIYMVANYRSRAPIIHAANGLIRNNRDRMDAPAVQPVRHDKADPVSILQTPSMPTMLKAALEQAHRLVAREGLSPGDVCILCRTNQEVFAITRLARRAGIEVFPVRRRKIPFPAIREVREILELLQRCGRSMCTGREVRELVEDLVAETTVRNTLWLDHLLVMARDYQEESGSVRRPLRDFCEYVWDVSRDLGRFERANAQGIGIATMHGAKGLEFPAVLLIGHPRLESNMEEARRLYYVGMTRARDRLFLCCAGRHPFVEEVRNAAPEWASMQEPVITLTPDEERETRAELWEMQLDEIHLSFPASKTGHPGTPTAIEALQTESGELMFKSGGKGFQVISNGIPVCALSAMGCRKYKTFQDRGLRVELIVHLASIHRTPSEQDQTGGWVDPERFPFWHVPLFQVIWKNEE